MAARPGAAGLLTAGARHSPQVETVAAIGATLGLPVRAHVPSGALTPELANARADGAHLIAHRPGYNTVIVARARADGAARPDWVHIPFGMECREAVTETAAQVTNLPGQVRRLVIVIGSGMSLAGVLHGLIAAGRSLPVLGVCVGANPVRRLDNWAPSDWRSRARLVDAGLPYHRVPARRSLYGVALDPVYEAKALPWLRPNDCLWVVGARRAVGSVRQPGVNG